MSDRSPWWNQREPDAEPRLEVVPDALRECGICRRPGIASEVHRQLARWLDPSQHNGRWVEAVPRCIDKPACLARVLAAGQAWPVDEAFRVGPIHMTPGTSTDPQSREAVMGMVAELLNADERRELDRPAGIEEGDLGPTQPDNVVPFPARPEPEPQPDPDDRWNQ